MFGYTVRKFAFNWLVIFALVLVIGAGFLGYNSITGDLDLFAGFGALGDLFGGLPSLGGIFVVVLMLGGLGWLLYHMTKTDYNGRGGLQAVHIVVVIAVVVIAAFVGFRWINVTDNLGPTFGLLVAILVVVTLVTALVTDRVKTVDATPTATIPVAHPTVH